MMARQLAEGYLDRRYHSPRKAGTTAREFDDEASAFMSDRAYRTLFEDMCRARSDDERCDDQSPDDSADDEKAQPYAEHSTSHDDSTSGDESTSPLAADTESTTPLMNDSTFQAEEKLSPSGEHSFSGEHRFPGEDSTFEAEEKVKEEDCESELSDPGAHFLHRFASVYERHDGDSPPSTRIAASPEQYVEAGRLGGDVHPITPTRRRVPARRPTSTSPTPRKVATNVRKYASVKRGAASHTPGGLTADDIIVSSSANKYVSKRLSETSKARYEGSLMQLFAHSREAVRAQFGSAPCGGKTTAGQAFLAAARAEYQLRLLDRAGDEA